MRTTALESVCEIEMGQAPKGASYNNKRVGYPLLAGAGDFGTEKPSPSKHTTAPTKLSKPDDILLCIRATVGDLNWSDKEYCLGRGVAGLRPKHGSLDKNYLWRWLLYARADLEKKARGSTFKQVSRRDIAELAIQLPETIDEQRHIAAILDKADGIRRKREQALVMADQILRSAFLKKFGHPLDPNGELARSDLGLHCDFFAGNSLPNGDEFTGQDRGLLLIKVSDLNSLGNEVEIKSAKLWAASRTAAKGGVVAPRGAVVFPKRGGAIATNKKRILERDSVLDPNLMAVAPKSESHISNEFLRTWFELIDLQTISSGSSVPQLNKRDLAPLALGVPDRQSVEWFNSVFSFTKSLKERLRMALVEDNRLFAAVSQKAFRGEL